MNFNQFYASSAAQTGSDTQDVSQGASAGRDTTQSGKPTTMGGQAVAVSWIGILLALVLLRVIYEVAD